MNRARWTLGLVVGALVAVLTGCATVPMGGPVSVQTAPVDNDQGSLAIIPNGPADGADPRTIVQGFVLAATEGRGYAIARQFLTPEASTAWRPDARVIVHDVGWTSRAVGDDGVTLVVRATAEVNEAGEYRATNRSETLPFRLAKVRGQWRITKAPDGVVLPDQQFQRVFQRKTLQFFDPSFRRLVPDPRWYPVTDSDSALVRGLIAGPTDVLTGVVESAFPAGATLVRMGRSGDVVEVALAVPGLQLSRTTTNRIQQQLLGSLKSPQPAGVRLVVNGAPAPAARALVASQPLQRPFVLAGERFGVLSDQGVTEDPGLSKRIADLRPTAVTLSTRQRLAAVLDAKGRAVLVPPTGSSRVVDDRKPLAEPTLDQNGWMWTVPRSEPDAVRVSSDKGGSIDLDDVRIGGAAVSAIEVSPDGTRLLVLLATDGRQRAFVAGIERDADGTPIGLTSASYTVSVPTSRPVDATWVDDESVAVLANDDAGQSVTVQPLGGPASGAPSRLSNATALVGTSGIDNLLALLQNGALYRRGNDNIWQPALSTSVKVDVLAVQR